MIKSIIAERMPNDGLVDTGIKGIQLFRATQPIPCVPSVYQPCVVAIVSGAKEAIFDGHRYTYGSDQYLCCPMAMPIMAGTSVASPDTPLLGVLITIDPALMASMAMEIDRAGQRTPATRNHPHSQGIQLANWDTAFTEAIIRLLQLGDKSVETAVLGDARLRELYFAILTGSAGGFARQSFGTGNAIARAISHISSHLSAPISIDDMAQNAGMSRAVFHRKFKDVAALSPMQFVKSMRLNSAAMQILQGKAVAVAALDVGYTSVSQFSREFKRTYGRSPKQWAANQKSALAMSPH